MRKSIIITAAEVHHEKLVESLAFAKDCSLTAKGNNKAGLCFIDGKYWRIKNPYREKQRKVEVLSGQEELLSAAYHTNKVPSTQKGGIIFEPFIVCEKKIKPSKSDNFMRIFSSYPT